MARAHHHYLAGRLWRLTHRCHQRQFLWRLEKASVNGCAVISQGESEVRSRDVVSRSLAQYRKNEGRGQLPGEYAMSLPPAGEPLPSMGPLCCVKHFTYI